MNILTKVYPSVLASEEKLILELEELLQSLGVSARICQRFLLVVSEAFTNAVIHGNGQNPQKTISAKISTNENFLSADITDQGNSGLDRIVNRRPPDLYAEGGRGIDMIMQYSSSVEFSEGDDGGLTVSIQLKRLEEDELIDS